MWNQLQNFLRHLNLSRMKSVFNRWYYAGCYLVAFLAWSRTPGSHFVLSLCCVLISCMFAKAHLPVLCNMPARLPTGLNTLIQSHWCVDYCKLYLPSLEQCFSTFWWWHSPPLSALLRPWWLRMADVLLPMLQQVGLSFKWGSNTEMLAQSHVQCGVGFPGMPQSVPLSEIDTKWWASFWYMAFSCRCSLSWLTRILLVVYLHISNHDILGMHFRKLVCVVLDDVLFEYLVLIPS